MAVSKNVFLIPARKHAHKSKDEEKPKLRYGCLLPCFHGQPENELPAMKHRLSITQPTYKGIDWMLAGIFADDGISGTNTKKREEFNRMIDECMAGNIDMIITKSISRFARNTLDCLKYIRQLKDKNIPVYFEKKT